MGGYGTGRLCRAPRTPSSDTRKDQGETPAHTDNAGES